MAISVRKRKKTQRHRQKLDLKAKDLMRRSRREAAENMTIPSVALGDLRRRWTKKQRPLHPAVERQITKFKRIPVNRAQRLLVYGSDGGLLLCRAHLDEPDTVRRLFESIISLPPSKHYKFRGIIRSDYGVRHYGVWGPYAPRPFYTRETHADGEIAMQFLARNERVFHKMSELLGELAPQCYKETQMYPLPDGIKRVCGAFLACAINNGGNNPNETNPHRDVNESRFGYSCVISCGDYTGGGLILYDLKIILEMQPGDMVLFPDSLLVHSNEAAQGERCSLVAFTQENVYDYWYRTFNMKLRRHAIQKTKPKARKRVWSDVSRRYIPII